MSSKIAQAGFVNLHEKTYKTPLGEWSSDPKLQELGKWNLLQFDVGLEGFCIQLLTNIMGVSSVLLHETSKGKWSSLEI